MAQPHDTARNIGLVALIGGGIGYALTRNPLMGALALAGGATAAGAEITRPKALPPTEPPKALPPPEPSLTLPPMPGPQPPPVPPTLPTALKAGDLVILDTFVFRGSSPVAAALLPENAADVAVELSGPPTPQSFSGRVVGYFMTTPYTRSNLKPVPPIPVANVPTVLISPTKTIIA